MIWTDSTGLATYWSVQVWQKCILFDILLSCALFYLFDAYDMVYVMNNKGKCYITQVFSDCILLCLLWTLDTSDEDHKVIFMFLL